MAFGRPATGMANPNSYTADTLDGEDTKDPLLCSVPVAPLARVEQDVPGPVKRQSVEREISPMRGQHPHIVAAVAGNQRTLWMQVMRTAKDMGRSVSAVRYISWCPGIIARVCRGEAALQGYEERLRAE